MNTINQDKLKEAYSYYYEMDGVISSSQTLQIVERTYGKEIADEISRNT